MFSEHTARSRFRLRGIATASAGGASAELSITPTGGRLTRRRNIGAATPAATRAQAPALIALEMCNRR